jgi:hypothetical protein
MPDDEAAPAGPPQTPEPPPPPPAPPEAPAPEPPPHDENLLDHGFATENTPEVR